MLKIPILDEPFSLTKESSLILRRLFLESHDRWGNFNYGLFAPYVSCIFQAQSLQTASLDTERMRVPFILMYKPAPTSATEQAF